MMMSKVNGTTEQLVCEGRCILWTPRLVGQANPLKMLHKSGIFNMFRQHVSDVVRPATLCKEKSVMRRRSCIHRSATAR